MRRELAKIKEIYEEGKNIVDYLKGGDTSKKSTKDMISISYEFQSGSYIRHVKQNLGFNKKYTKAITRVIDGLGTDYDSILEAGVGEATTLANVIQKLKNRPQKIYGFDLSWSRVRYAIEYMKKKRIRNSFLFAADLFDIPMADNSVDIVYTAHSIEPNRGREKEALLELMRITKNYLVLLEPSYEFASNEARRKMERYGYVRNLYSVACSLGLKIIEHRLFDVYSDPLNPTGLIIIEKSRKNRKKTVGNPLICPVTKKPLKLIKNSYFSKEGLLVYPIIDGVPCLLSNNAVIATHYADNFQRI